MVQVRTGDGYIRAFGIGAARDFAGRRLTLVEVGYPPDAELAARADVTRRRREPASGVEAGSG